ncbi:MAG: MFS transporter [Nocardioides sp.]
MVAPGTLAGRLRAARNPVGWSFFLNGFLFAAWVSRIPAARTELSLSNSQLGFLLLAISVGSLLAMPATGGVVQRLGTARVVGLASALAGIGIGIAAVGVGVIESVPVTALGLFAFGAGNGLWDPAMNIEAAEVERRLGRTIMPRFHAGWSLGTVAGALVGTLAIGIGLSSYLHLLGVATLSCVGVVVSVGGFISAVPEAGERGSAWRAWLEWQTLLIGLMVLALTLVEGAANDWLAIALIDGYGAADWIGLAGLSVFTAAMTLGRLTGPILLDRFGPAPMLLGTISAAIVGLLVVVLGPNLATAAAGIVMWGLGASLGFPVGISLAARDPRFAAVRVSVVSTIGYGAFFAGPPLLGFAGDQVGTLHSLLVLIGVLALALTIVPVATRRPT